MRKTISVIMVTMLAFTVGIFPVAYAAETVSVSADYIPGEKPANLVKGAYSSNGFQNVGADSSAKTYASYLAGEVNRYEFIRQAGNENTRRVEGYDIQVKYKNGEIDKNGGMQEYFKPSTNYVFSADVRLPDTALFSDEINTNETSVPFAMGLSLNGNPVGNDIVMQEITNKSLQEFKGVVTTPEFDEGKNNYALSIGLPDSYTTNGGAVVLNLSSEKPYLAEEVAYDLSCAVTEGSATLIAGENQKIILKAKLLNQIGLAMKSEGGFKWYAVNEAKNKTVNGITITPTANEGEVEVSAAAGVKEGTYYIAVKPATKDWYKSIEINVFDKEPLPSQVTDYIPSEMPANILMNSNSGNGYQGVGVNTTTGTYLNYLSGNGINRYEFKRNGTANNSRRIEGVDIQVKTKQDENGNTIIDKNGGMQEYFKPNTNYVFSANVRLSDAAMGETGTTETSVPFAVGLSNGGQPVGTAADDVVQYVTSKELQKFKTVIKTPNFISNANSQNYYQLSIGLPDSYTKVGGAVVLDLNSDEQPYFAPETAYDISCEILEGNNVLKEGENANLKIKADILNQVGLPMEASSGFVWYAVNENKTAEVEEITVAQEATSNIVNVTIGSELKSGTYYVLAKDKANGRFKSVKIVVQSSKDYVPGEKPQNMITDATELDTYNWLGASYRANGSKDVDTLDGKIVLKFDENVSDSTGWNPNGIRVADGKLSGSFEQNKKYVVSATVQKLSPSDTSSVKFAAGIGLYNTAQTVIAEQELSATGPTEFKQVIAVGSNSRNDYLKLGIPRTETKEVSALISLASGYEPYVAEEVLYDITNKAIEGSVIFTRGTGGNLKAKAMLVNQIGLMVDTPQSFTWTALNEEGAKADGISIVPNTKFNTAEVSVSASVEAGLYRIVAQSNEHYQFRKSLWIYVTENGAKQISINVSPRGNDANSGSKAFPLKTLGKAKERVAELRALGIDCEVLIAGGEYRIEDSLYFGEKDSGTASTYVIYKGAENNKPVIKGSVVLDTDAAYRVSDTSVLERLHPNAVGKIVEIDLAAQGLTKDDIFDVETVDFNNSALAENGEYNSLYINGKEGELAHWPNGGRYANFENWETDLDNDKSNDSWSKGTADVFYYKSSDTAPARWTEAKNWWVKAYAKNDYSCGRMMAKSVNPNDRSITLQEDVFSTGGYIGLNTNRWQAYNLLEELDIPGEFYIDRDSMKLYYYPIGDLSTTKLELSVASKPMFNIRNAHDISFENICFTQSRYHAAEMVDVKNVDFTGCDFKYISGAGIYISGSNWAITQSGEVGTLNAVWNRSKKDGSYNVNISDCSFFEIGSAGIDISGGNVDTLTPSGNIIENNIFNRTGQRHHLLSDSIMLRGCGITVKNNEFGGIPNQAIRVWGNDHIIEYNEFYDVIQEVTDAGAIYRERNEIGRGDIVRYNYFHDFDITDGFGEHGEGLSGQGKVYRIGVYWDGYQQGCTAEHNIFYNIPMGLQSTGTSAMTDRYNTAIDVKYPRRYTPTLYETNDLDNCIAAATTAQTSATVADTVSSIADKELYFEKYPALKEWASGTNPVKYTTIAENLGVGSVSTEMEISTATKNNAAITKNSYVASCNDFVDAKNQDFRIKNGSSTASSMPNLVNESNLSSMNLIGLQRSISFDTEASEFELLYPIKNQGINISDALEFVWQEAFGATKYRLLIADNKEFNNPVVDKKSEFRSYIVPANIFAANKEYYWKVEASNPSLHHTTVWTNVGGAASFSTGIKLAGFSASLEGSSVNVTGEIQNISSSYSEDSIVYIAVYSDNGALKKIEKLNKSKNQNLVINTTIALNDNNAKYVKLFSWNDKMQPQLSCEKYELKRS